VFFLQGTNRSLLDPRVGASFVSRHALTIGLAIIVVLGVWGAVYEFSSPEPAQAAALAKIRSERHGVSWRVTATQFYWRPYQVYDSAGRLRQSATDSGCPVIGSFVRVYFPPFPEWVVYLAGTSQDRRYTYDA
jgi:hypothetical protein